MLFRASNNLHKNVICFTTSTLNGMSVGDYESFNLGNHVGDDPDKVSENRKILDNIIINEIKQQKGSTCNQTKSIKWLKQDHTNCHQFYESIDLESTCDAISTLNPLTPLAIMTADCLPIVLSGSKGQISAIHAGWRGLLNNIIENTVSEYAHNQIIHAWIGPGICKKHFEITSELVSAFSNYSSYIEHLEGKKYLVDLVGIAKEKLTALGVTQVQVSDICTYQHPFCYSHRKSIHQGRSSTGRMATIVMKV